MSPVKRALVLGGGGTIGVAWETAILAGLLEHGLDARDADLIVGTSAGSIVGSWVGHRHDLVQRVRDSGQRSTGAPVASPNPTKGVAHVFRLWSSFDAMTTERCAQIGALAVAAETVSQEEWLGGFIDHGAAWPDTPLWVCAVDCLNGEFRVFTKDDGVPMNVALAASCSVPGLFPTVSIDGRQYTDGGVRSWTSADIVAPESPDRVLIVAPAGSPDAPGVMGLAARQLAAEIDQLQRAGAETQLVVMDEAARAASPNWMSTDGRPAAMEAAAAHAARIAPELRAWWSAPELRAWWSG